MKESANARRTDARPVGQGLDFRGGQLSGYTLRSHVARSLCDAVRVCRSVSRRRQARFHTFFFFLGPRPLPNVRSFTS